MGSSDELRHNIEECFNRYSAKYVWLYMQNKEDVDRLYPELVNELYNIISGEKSKVDG